MSIPEANLNPIAQSLREKLEEARLAELAVRREKPLWRVADDAPTGIHLGTVENLRQRATRRPAMGPRSIFVIGRAEQMVSQAASQEAANAFLKLLEEPPPDVYLLLTSSRPGALLPTVLSRVLSVRVLPLQDREVTEFLETHGGASADDAARAARLAQGSIGRALDVLGGEEARYSDAERLLAAAVSGKRSDRFSYSLSLSSRGARGGFLSVLDAAGELLRDQLVLATGNESGVLDH